MLPNIDNIERHAIFLDLDGTVAELVAHPDAVQVDRSTLRLLETLTKKVGRALAVVSGREIAVVDRLLRPLVLPVAGVHGLERRDARGIIHSRDTADISSIVFDLEKAFSHEVGVMIERKPGAIALHYRLRPDLQRHCRDIAHGVVEKRPDLRLLQGKMVYEIMPRGSDKGGAIQAFLSESPFLGRRPIFAGDDITDEAGFSVVNARNGISIKIGAGESLARFRAHDVRQFRAWLSGLVSNRCEEPVR
ncbi:MAG TPA: trehalose-phosphatase [Methylocystis sp.]